MHEALTAAEVLLFAAVSVVFLGLAFLMYRTHTLSKDGQLAVLALRFPGENWRTGMVRYRANRLEWFAFRTMRLTPDYTWDRGEFYLGSRNPLDAHEVPRAMSGDAVAVEVQCAQQSFTIAMSPHDYTALRSWSESAPPGLYADRF